MHNRKRLGLFKTNNDLVWELQPTQTEADEHLADLTQPQPEQVHEGEVGGHRKDEGVYLQALNIK
jgi:hypothetical protein